MEAIYVDGEKLNIEFIETIAPDFEGIHFVNRTLGGSWVIQSVGSEAKYLDITVYVNDTVRNDITNYWDGGNAMTVYHRNTYEKGFIMEKPEKEIAVKGGSQVWKMSFKIAVTERSATAI